MPAALGPPKPYSASEYAAGAQGYNSFRSFQVTIVNNSPTPYDPSGFRATAQSGNTEARRSSTTGVAGGDIGGSPSTPVLPGRETMFTIAYGVTTPSDIVMQASPGNEYRDLILTP